MAERLLHEDDHLKTLSKPPKENLKGEEGNPRALKNVPGNTSVAGGMQGKGK